MSCPLLKVISYIRVEVHTRPCKSIIGCQATCAHRFPVVVGELCLALIFHHAFHSAVMFLHEQLNIEHELERIQTQMAQKQMLRAEVYGHALHASQNVKRAEVWVGARCA
jgi:hypothetical protein